MKYFTLTAALSGLLLFASCDKKEETKPSTTTPATKTKKELIVDGKWQMTDLAFVMKNGAGQDSLVNGWSIVDDCTKDDFMTFTADGKGVIDEGATKCDAADPQTENVTWELLNNETEVKVVTPDETQVLKIMELTATKAVYRQSFTQGAQTMTVEQTFKNIK